MNIIEARKTLGNLIKMAKANWPDSPLASCSITDCKQGKGGFNAATVWPIVDRMNQSFPIPLPTDREAVAGLAVAAEGPASAAECIIRAVTIDMLPNNGKAPEAAPEAAPEDAPEVTAPAAPATPATSAMQVALEAMQAAAAEADAQSATAATTAADVAALKQSVTAIAKRLQEVKDQPQEATVSPATIKATVAQVITDLAPSNEVVEAAAEGARELPPVEAIDPTFVEPDWADDVRIMMGAGFHIAVGGSSGAGKTFPLRQIAATLGVPSKVISANDGVDAETIVASPALKDGNSVYVDGPLTHAMRHGYLLIIDEGDSIRRDEALIFNDPMEVGRLTIPQTGEVVHASQGFGLAFTSNSLGDELGLYNREGFDESLQQRCKVVIAKPLTLQQDIDILTRVQSPSGSALTAEEAEILAKWAHAARPLHFGLNGSEPVLSSCCSTRTLVEAAGLWLGFNKRNGATFTPWRDSKGGDVRTSLWYPYASKCSTEEVESLKAANLWVWG